MLLVLPWVLVALLGLVLAFAFLPSSNDRGAAETETVVVAFQLVDPDTAFSGCVGSGGYSDIAPGTPVTIKNGSGEVLGAGGLGQGTASRSGPQLTFCDWTVSIPGVPAGEDFYSAEVGSRGAITVSGSQLEADGWRFAVSLGS